MLHFTVVNPAMLETNAQLELHVDDICT